MKNSYPVLSTADCIVPCTDELVEGLLWRLLKPLLEQLPSQCSSSCRLSAATFLNRWESYFSGLAR